MGAAFGSRPWCYRGPVTERRDVGTSGQRAFASNAAASIYVAVNGTSPAEGAGTILQ